MKTLSLDFETRSTIDLTKTGVYPYAADPSTEVLCMAYAEDGMEPMLWVPGDSVPGSVTQALADGAEFRAWNAAFERAMWRVMVRDHGFPEVPFESWTCTMMEASAMSLPRSLGKCADVLKVADQKDQSGHRLMLQMCKPRKPRKDEAPDGLYWWEDEVRLQKLYKYCLDDVRAENAIAKNLRRLHPNEKLLYQLDQRANDYGVGLDVPLIEACMDLRDEAIERANKRLRLLTNGACQKITGTADLREWLGVPSIAKAAVKELLETETDGTHLEVLKLRAEAGKSSVAKLDTMMKVLFKGAAHGLLQFLGADTGRWAGRLVQPQNFPRPPKGIEEFIPLVMARDYDAIAKKMPVMEVISGLLRSCLIPQKGRFLCADFSAIEGWVVAWLAGQPGMTSYEEMAGLIFNRAEHNISEDERAVGKTTVLGCGFGMGVDKYIDTVYDWTGIRILDEDCAGCQAHERGNKVAHEGCTGQVAVGTYREINHQIVALWRELEHAALEAVRYPGRIVRCGHRGMIRYRVKGPYLWAVLPSGRALCYPLPIIKQVLTPWGQMKAAVEISTTNSVTRKWERRSLYGGLQCENLVQAIARDVMAEAMQRTDAAGYPTVLTVHDEVLTESEIGTLDEFCDLMKVSPEWATGLQIHVTGWEGERYRK